MSRPLTPVGGFGTGRSRRTIVILYGRFWSIKISVRLVRSGCGMGDFGPFKVFMGTETIDAGVFCGGDL